jgi:hypothetical protein
MNSSALLARVMAVSISAMLVGAMMQPTPAAAQEMEVSALGGVQVPLGGMAQYRTPGPRVGVAIGYHLAGSPWSFRAELTSGRLMEVAEDREGYPPFRPGDLASHGVALAAIRRMGEGTVQPYLLTGVGGYRMQIEESGPNPYGTIGALFAGGGLQREMGPWRLFAETRAKITLSDYGSREFSPGIQLPTTVGIGRSVGTPDLSALRLDGSGPDLLPWTADHSRYLTLPTGRGLGAGTIHASAAGLWTAMTAEGLEPGDPFFVRPTVWLGLADWLSVHAGFWPKRMPDRDFLEEYPDTRIHQDGQIAGGAELTLPLERWSISGGAQLTHPRRNEFGRTISESVFYGVGHRETARGGYTLGAGWRGYPSGGDRRGWTGDAFLMGGVHRRLLPQLEGVAEGHLGAGYVKFRPGLRTGIAGLNVEASYRCVLAVVMATTVRCVGPNFTAAYRLQLPGLR